MPATKMIRLLNKLDQPVKAQVLNDQGAAVEVRIPPRGQSDPLREDWLSEYTDGLIAKGHLKKIPA